MCICRSYPSIHPPIYLFIYPFIYLFIYPFIHLFIYPYYPSHHLLIASIATIAPIPSITIAHPSHLSHPSYPSIHLVHLPTYLPTPLSTNLCISSISLYLVIAIDISMYPQTTSPPTPSFTPHQTALVGGTRRADRMADAVLSHLSFCPSAYPPHAALRTICPSVKPPFGPSVRPPFGPFSRSRFVYCTVVPFSRLPFCSSVFLFIFRPFCWFVLPTSVSHSVLRFFCPSLRLSVRLLFCPSVSQSISPSARLLPSYCFLPFLPSVPPLLG